MFLPARSGSTAAQSPVSSVTAGHGGRIAGGYEPLALDPRGRHIFGGNAQARSCRRRFWIPADSQIIKPRNDSPLHDLRPAPGRGDRRQAQSRRLRHIHLGGGAYILSRTAASALLGQTAPFSFSVDNVLFDPDCPEFCGLETLQMVPAPCVQAAMAPKQLRTVTLPSTLQGTRRRKFAKGLKRLGQKAAREIAKRRLVIRGLLFDRLRGFKTARIPFQ